MAGNNSAYATSIVEPVPEKSQTEVTVGLTRKIAADKLPGGGEQSLITKPTISSGKILPQTGAKSTIVYPLLGLFFAIFSIFLYVFKKKERVKDYEI